MSKHRASHRAARRHRRLGVLGLALGVTVAIGGAAVGVLPQLKADQASADAFRPSAAGIETATLSSIPIPKPTSEAEVVKATVPDVPKGSGDGRRIVFDQGDQRVWLVDDTNRVVRTYLVSGSRFDNLRPGAYAVQSKVHTATAYDSSGTMEYFVRFATGVSEPIGFHSLPIDNSGKPKQTRAQLGTRLSDGCVRQWKPDAIALWDFAPVGTKVYVTA